MRVRILNKRWILQFVTRLGKVGACEDGDIDAPDVVDKKIRIRHGLTDKKLMEVLIHEIAHGANWHLDEEWIHEFAHDCANILYRMGYRRVKKAKE